MAGPLRPNPTPPSSLMTVEILERWKKRFKKSFFFLNGPAIKRKTVYYYLKLYWCQYAVFIMLCCCIHFVEGKLL